MEEKLKRVVEFYSFTHKLKTLIRTGWKIWGVKGDRLESVAEHIYGTQMLAFAINNEFNLGVDMQKVAYMLAFHELGECIVGDITIFSRVTKEEKHQHELNAVNKLLNLLSNNDLKEEVFFLFNEFEERKTKEAIFAHMIDKFECDLQVKYYDEKGCCDFNFKQAGRQEEIRQNSLKHGDKTFSQMWINYDKEHVGYDDLFNDFADYIIAHKIFK